MNFPFVESFRLALLFHFLGFSLGVGGAFVTDTLFFRFLKDLRISKREANIMKALSKVLWAGMFLLLFSGLWLFSLDPVTYSASSKFLAKMTIVFFLFANGVILHIYFTPHLHKVAYGGHYKYMKKHASLRKGAFAAGAISMSSWLFVLVLAWSKWPGISYIQYMGIYLVIVGFAILTSIMIDKKLESKRK